MPIADDRSVMPNVDVTAFIDNHIRGQRRWYEQEAAKYEFRLSLWRGISVISGLFATAFAAFPPTLAVVILKCAEGGEITRWLAVVFSATASLTSGVLQSYYSQLARRRETGRVQTSYIEQVVSATLYEKPMSLDERIKYKTKTISDLTAIEMAYGAPVGMMPTSHGHVGETA